MDHNNSSSHLHRQLDWVTTLIPFGAILVLCLLFLLAPEQSGQVLSSIRFFLGDELGSYYLLIGLGVFLCSLYIAFSPYGQIRLGDREKPQYSSFQWGSMMFTAGLAADILFYSLCEWILYAGEDRISQMGSIQDWASTYPLFHWGPIPWSFYLVLASAFGFMLHVRKCDKQKYSEACRPLLGCRVDGFWGKLIDLLAVFALLAGTATTFSLATPLLSMAISHVFHIPASNLLTIGLLAIIGITYTIAVYFGMKGVSKLASSCTYLFFALLLYVLIGGGKARYTIETGITAIGNLTQNVYLDRCPPHLLLSTDLDHFLLGLLDGMVRGNSIFHRFHQRWPDHPADHPGRLLLGAGRHLHLLYHPGKLRLKPSDDRENGSDRLIPGIR